eukprot:gene10519-21938_t
MEQFLSQCTSVHIEQSFKCSHDGTTISYRRIGNGPRVVLLANGVGTNFFMWLPALRTMHYLYPNLFNEITLIAPYYRGLFSKSSHPKNDIKVTMTNCVEDAHEVLSHCKCTKFDTIIGWSTGAQMALSLCTKYPHSTDRLFLLNPSVGKTLHTVFQPIHPLPSFIGISLSKVLHTAIQLVRPLCDLTLWKYIRIAAISNIFYCILIVFAFLGGAPPEQPDYFYEYICDLFSTPSHTKHLLDLILALDADSPPGATKLPQKSIIVSGYPDFITGVYHSNLLAKEMPHAKHTVFTMGSHFVILEWPNEVAKLILELLFDKN